MIKLHKEMNENWYIVKNKSLTLLYLSSYRLENSNKQGVVVTGGSFFSRGSRFRYAGRCEKEVVEESSTIIREPPTVNRISLRTIGRSTSLPTTPADSDTYDGDVSTCFLCRFIDLSVMSNAIFYYVQTMVFSIISLWCVDVVFLVFLFFHFFLLHYPFLFCFSQCESISKVINPLMNPVMTVVGSYSLQSNWLWNAIIMCIMFCSHKLWLSFSLGREEWIKHSGIIMIKAGIVCNTDFHPYILNQDTVLLQ